MMQLRSSAQFADYDGDGKTDVGVWRPSTAMWYFLGSRDGVVHSQQLGLPSDIPVPTTNWLGGYSAVWRPSAGRWYYKTFLDSGVGTPQFGLNGDVPIFFYPYTYVAWRPANGNWYSGSGASLPSWGLSGDVLVGAPHTATQ